MPSKYEAILAPYLGEYEILRYCDYVRQADIGERKILLVRHDVDHDYVTAVKMGQWEYRRNIRATYCLLHSSWYYGKLEHGHYEHTKDLLCCARSLQGLGHEVNFHNNLVATALRENVDPVGLLEEELAFFRDHGISIVGTAT
ncbi:unnamed protein product, partial [marine sediment metagenome]